MERVVLSKRVITLLSHKKFFLFYTKTYLIMRIARTYI